MRACKNTCVFGIGMYCVAGCTTNDNRKAISEILTSQEEKHISFIDRKYDDATPLAQLINPPVYSADSQSFQLQKETNVQVYASGETLFNLSDVDRKYYLQGDDIELHLQLPDHENTGGQHHARHYIFAYKEAKKKYQPEGIAFEWKNIDNIKYEAEIGIPWQHIGIPSPQHDLTLGVDIAIGDNDDGYIQETRLAWSGATTTATYSTLRLTGNIQQQTSGIQSVYAPSKATRGELWHTLQPYSIQHIVRGFIKDPLDLSAEVRTCWDKDYLYFHFSVTDSRQKHIPQNKRKERNILVDYGWIENATGETIWEMAAGESTHAGGSYKNQKTDTLLHLSPGVYTVRYISDESHAFNNWIDTPPALPFYGIIVYSQIH